MRIEIQRGFLMKKCVLVVMALCCCFFNANMSFAEQKADFGGAGRYAAVGFAIDGKGYVGTGYDGATSYKDFWAYDPDTNAWTQKADFGGAGRYAAVGFAIDGKGYVGTGYNGETNYKDFWTYDPTANTWTRKADFGGVRRNGAVGFVIDDKGYVGTGGDGSTNYQDFWVYDPTTDAWTSKAAFGGEARIFAVGFAIGSKGYVGSGLNGSAKYSDFWAYDPVTNTWLQKTDAGAAARYGVVGFAIGSKGYAGTGYDDSVNYKDFGEYDPATDTWTPKVDFEGAERGFSVAFVIGSKGYIGLGLGGSTKYNDLWEYDPTIDITPDPFTFVDQTEVAWNSTITSNAITVSGIEAKIVISIEGGTYSINGGDYTSETGTVSNGDIVTVRQTSSSIFHTTTDATLTIGSVSDTFSVTTKYIYDEGESGPCFIATAAFGSPLAGQVKILRQFRDRYLLTNGWGRKFVAWYYRNGSVAARFIEDKPLIKIAVRTALYPLVGFAWLLISGYLSVVLLGFLLAAFLVYRYRPGQSKIA